MWPLIKNTAIVLYFLGTNVAHSQVRIYGTISNQSGHTLPFASVKVKKDSTAPLKKFSIASEKGVYEITLPAHFLPAILEASVVGYKSKILRVEDQGSRDIKVNFFLDSLDKPLPEVFIKTDLAITVSGDTISFKTDSFKLGNERNIGELLKNMPGFVVQDNGKIVFNGKPISKILIEGDDLTGRKYESLTQNLDINGIDKVQVIRHYKDPEDITSTLKASSEQVLNIRYKKKFLGKVFGNLEAGMEPRPLYYTLAGQVISLKEKFKSLLLQESNTSGELKLSGQENIVIDGSQGNNSNPELSLASPTSLADIADIKNARTTLPLFYSNNSFLGSFNYKYRLSKKIIIKGVTGYIRDRYNQDAGTVNTIFAAPQNIILRQQEVLKKINTNFNSALLVNYLINNKNQLLGQLKLEREKPDYLSSGLLQGDPYIERKEGTNSRSGAGIYYTHLFKKGSWLESGFEYQKALVTGQYIESPPNYDSLFYPALFQNIRQDEWQKFSSQSAHFLFQKKMQRSQVGVIVDYHYQQENFLNTILGFNASGPMQMSTPDSANDFRFRQRSIGIKFNHQLAWGKHINFQYLPGVVHLDDQSKTRKNNLNKFYFLPQANIDFELSKLDKLTLSYISQITDPGIKDIAGGYFLTGLTSVQKGDDSIFAATTRTANISFSHIDLVRHGFIFFSQLSFTKRPLLYLSNSLPNTHYTIATAEATGKNISLGVFSVGADKFIYEAKSKIAFRYNLVSGNSFHKVNGLESEYGFTRMSFEPSFHTQVKHFQLSGSGKYFITTQKNSSQHSQKTATHDMEIQTEASWKIFPVFIVSCNIRNEWNHPPHAQTGYISVAGTEIRYTPKKDKWSGGLTCTNLFNQNKFSYSVILPGQTFFAEYRLVSRIILASVKYKF